jgi:hypothetical protein
MSVPQQCAADDQPHDLVSAFKNLMDANVAQHPLDRVVAQVAKAAVQLETTIKDIEARISRIELAMAASFVAAALRKASTGNTAPSSQSRAYGIISSRANWRAVDRNACCSSVRSKFMAPLAPSNPD